jgi:hypothetical protein
MANHQYMSHSMSPTNGLSFSLLKVSYATDPIEAKKFDWKYETRDVRLLFDNYGSFNSYQQMSPILKVLQGDAVLV